ncbi:MAG: hypothetical protein Q9215_005400 [Flavoplaca cf. flavocitrina]
MCRCRSVDRSVEKSMKERDGLTRYKGGIERAKMKNDEEPSKRRADPEYFDSIVLICWRGEGVSNGLAAETGPAPERGCGGAEEGD